MTTWTAARQASLSFTIYWSVLNLMPIESVMPSNHLILCCPLPRLPSIFPSIRVLSNESGLHISGQSIGVSASVSVFPVNIQGLLHLGLMVGSPCNPRDPHESSPAPQFESINSLALSLLYGPTLTSVQTPEKTIALTIETCVSKVISLLFDTLSMLIIAFLPRRKCFLISQLQLLSAVIFNPRK